jgi:hypothetical protein
MVHLRKNIRQTNGLAQFGPNTRAPGTTAKFAFECALYMILEVPKTLTVQGLPPIRPRFLEMDEILNPRAAD